MADDRRKLSRWTLRFANKALESNYEHFDIADDRRIVRIIIGISGVVLVLSRLGFSFVGFPMDLPGILHMAIGGFFLFLFAISRIPIVIQYERPVTFLATLISAVFLGTLLITGADVTGSIMFGVPILFVMTVAIIPISWLQKSSTIAVVITTTLFWVWTAMADDPLNRGVAACQVVVAMVIALAVSYALEISRRRRFLGELDRMAAQARSKEILYNVLPRTVANRLIEADPDDKIVDHADNVAVLFADLVGFTPFAAKSSPADLVKTLDMMFARFDVICEQHGLEKIKTIGDAYMAVAGLPEPIDRPAHRAAAAALDFISAIERLKALGAVDFEIRVGLHVGPVVAGVIGRQRFLYDLWGDTVNVASRLEASGIPNRVHLSMEAAKVLEGDFATEKRGVVTLKGRGSVETYFLTGRQSQTN